jgi:hypothetical protein
MILRQSKFIVIICAGLFCCSQAIAGGIFMVSSKTSVTGGSIVRIGGEELDVYEITIKELSTNKLMDFYFLNGDFQVEGRDYLKGTEVIVG